ncbi:MAG: ATP-binding protein [Ilumatobacteraceae bacterium]
MSADPIAPAEALLPALERLDALLRAVAEGEPGPATIAVPGSGAETASRLTQLGDALRLESFDLDVLLLAMAPELDRGYAPLFAALQHDPFAWRPSVEVILRVLCPTDGERLGRRAHLGPHAPLVTMELIRLVPFVRPDAAETALVEPDPRIVDHLLGVDGLDPRLAPVCRMLGPDSCQGEADRSTVAMLERLGDRSALVLEARRAASGIDAAHALAAEGRRQLLVLDIDRAARRGLDLERTLRLAVREAAMARAMLCLSTGGQPPTALDDLGAALGPYRGPLLVVTPDARSIERPDLEVLVAPVSLPDPAARQRLWAAALGEVPSGTDLSVIASRFRLDGDQIASAARAARARAHRRGCTGGDELLSPGDLFAAARRRSRAELGGSARRIESVFGWDDLVLPEDSRAQLQELCSRVAHRDKVIDDWGFRRTLGAGVGVSALFTGSSGTGKTMAAGVLANALELDLWAIDLAAIVSKYIGETSKNLDRMFGAAEESNAILFFDEADALFGKRSEVRDSHDRYANVEIAYLLQKMEAYDGVAILATNLRQNLDDAFARRLAFTVHFPFPSETDRLEIWRRVWPEEVELTPDADLADLAARFRLSGGNIRNAALAAAFLAATDATEVRREHLLRAIRREYQKLGRGLSDAELIGEEPTFGGATA